MSDPIPFDINRDSSAVLDEVRTVHSRAQTALRSVERLKDEPLHWWTPNWRDHYEWAIVYDFQKDRAGDTPSQPHPEIEEILTRLRQVVELLEPYARTKTPRRRKKVAK